MLGGRPALVISYVDGVTLAEVTSLELPELEEKLEKAFWPLQRYGVVQDDATLNNFLLVDGRIVIVDLERLYEPADPDQVAFAAESSIDMALRYYKTNKEWADYW